MRLENEFVFSFKWSLKRDVLDGECREVKNESRILITYQRLYEHPNNYTIIYTYYLKASSETEKLLQK